jgi:hypothetical protein
MNIIPYTAELYFTDCRIPKENVWEKREAVLSN